MTIISYRTILVRSYYDFIKTIYIILSFSYDVFEMIVMQVSVTP